MVVQMCERFAKIWTVVVLLLAIVLLRGDIIVCFFAPIQRSNSPCECLTGIFSDGALRSALRRQGPFIGIHWREFRSRVGPFFAMWGLKYANCLTLHELYIPLGGVELNWSEKINEGTTLAVEEALRRHIEDDITGDGKSDNSNSEKLVMRDSGLFAIQRVWRRGGRISSSSSSSLAYGGSPTCHVWILPETTHLPLELWLALRVLLEEGRLAGDSVHITGDGGERNMWTHYQPFGVLLWADPNDRESLKRVVPSRTVMMFTTIRQ